MPMSPRLLRPRASGFVLPSDADARAYVLAVNTADGQPLEAPVVQAIDDFVIGCKTDNIWSAIKASCILMGARTLSGALTPLVGSAPTNNGPFVSGDYDRKTGLTGNASTKFLNSNRAGSADGQNDFHLSIYNHAVHSNTTAAGAYIGHGGTASGASNLLRNLVSPGVLGAHLVRLRSSANSGSVGDSTPPAGLFGASRGSSGSYTVRTGGQDFTISTTSETPPSESLFVVARNSGTGSAQLHANATMSFYSIGSALTLSLLDSRVATLYTALRAAIP